MLIEVATQFYRAVVPTVPWLYYLFDDRPGGAMWYSIVLMVLYVVCKVSVKLLTYFLFGLLINSKDSMHVKVYFQIVDLYFIYIAFYTVFLLSLLFSCISLKF